MNQQVFLVLSNQTRRKIIETLMRENLSFSELMRMVDQSNHGGFGYHIRALKGFIRLDPLTKKYCLTDSGLSLATLLNNYQKLTLDNKKFEDYARKLRLGDHAVAFSSTEDFKCSIVLPFVKAGLSREEAVLYLASENKLDYETKEIHRYCIELNKLPKEAFTIMSADEWYLRKGKAEGETIIANWLELAEEKEKLGFKGLHVTGEMDVFFDYAKSELLRYEELLGRQLSQNMCGLCLYDAGRLEEEDFSRVFKSHGHIISKGVVGKI